MVENVAQATEVARQVGVIATFISVVLALVYFVFVLILCRSSVRFSY